MKGREWRQNGEFWGTRVLEIMKKHDFGGLVWKKIEITSIRKPNAKNIYAVFGIMKMS